MIRALLVVAVLVSGCGTPECRASSPDVSFCDVTSIQKDGSGVGTRLMQCGPRGSSYTLCANGCRAQGAHDVCNP